MVSILSSGHELESAGKREPQLRSWLYPIGLWPFMKDIFLINDGGEGFSLLWMVLTLERWTWYKKGRWGSHRKSKPVSRVPDGLCFGLSIMMIGTSKPKKPVPSPKLLFFLTIEIESKPKHPVSGIFFIVIKNLLIKHPCRTSWPHLLNQKMI